MDICKFWRATLGQDALAMRGFFRPDATINWHCSNERFTLEEFIRANCEYPGDWDGEVERVEQIGNLIITVVRAYPVDRSASFHVVSFMQIADNKIAVLDEYWADDGDAPKWRKEMRIGRPIK